MKYWLSFIDLLSQHQSREGFPMGRAVLYLRVTVPGWGELSV